MPTYTCDTSGNGNFYWAAGDVPSYGGMIVATRKDGSYSVLFDSGESQTFMAPDYVDPGCSSGFSPAFSSVLGPVSPGLPQVIEYPHNKERPLLAPLAESGWNALTNPNKDTARYILKPQTDFELPWLAIPGGRAFVWPMGVEGYSYAIQASLGIHKYIGDIQVDVEVMHRGEERITMTGTFPGHTSVANQNALRDIVTSDTPERGKILHLPNILPRYQYVIVDSAQFDRPQEEILRDLQYSINFVKIGIGAKASGGGNRPPVPNPQNSTVPAKGTTVRQFITTNDVRTAQQIAQLKLNSAERWSEIVAKNTRLYVEAGIPAFLQPAIRLAIGVAVNY